MQQCVAFNLEKAFPFCSHVNVINEQVIMIDMNCLALAVPYWCQQWQNPAYSLTILVTFTHFLNKFIFAA